MSNLYLRLDELRESSVNELYDRLSEQEGEVVLVIKHPSVGFAGEHLSIAEDDLDILFIGETIAEYCDQISYQRHWESYHLYIHFTFTPNNVRAIAEKLVWILSGLYRAAPDDENDDLDNDVRKAIADFGQDLDKHPLHFYDLADDYLINFLFGVSEEYGDEALVELSRNHPERRYRFIRPLESVRLGDVFYVSPWSWIVPYQSNLDLLLTRYAGFDVLPVMKTAQRIETNLVPSIVFNDEVFAFFPEDEFEDARRCANELYLQPAFVTHSVTDMDAPFYIPSEIQLSREGNILVVSDRIARYVFFEFEKIPFESGQKYLNKIAETLHKLQLTVNGPSSIACPWNMLDDELFEQLCYDVMYHSGDYDTKTIKKMGVSRSRDGGRDIEAFTLKRIGTTSTKWITQCKFLKSGGSLSANKFNSISDVIEQYGTGGFCVMTNGVIDSTRSHAE